MGENGTASFDPIFFFHHSFVDKLFWDWQKNWDSKLSSRTQLTIEVEYPGTNSVDYQGPTPSVAGNTWLTMDSPLAPFTRDDKQSGDPLTSKVSLQNDTAPTSSLLPVAWSVFANGVTCLLTI
jgi:tyrosinase